MNAPRVEVGVIALPGGMMVATFSEAHQNVIRRVLDHYSYDDTTLDDISDEAEELALADLCTVFGARY